METALAEAPAPEGIATRAQVEAALRDHAAPVRFTGWGLAGLDLRELDFHGCEFLRCRAGRADFSGCDLGEARFLACDFNNPLCRRTTLSAALFRDCKLTGLQIVSAATIGLAFERCLLVDAQLQGLSFRQAALDGLDFQGADLIEADFRQAVLTGCNLRDANLTRARFEGADLRGADLGSLQLTDITRFRGAVISRQQAAEIVSRLGLKVA